MSDSPWTACEKGHDLTAPDSYIIGLMGRRFCRQCVRESQRRPRERSTFGAFDG